MTQHILVLGTDHRFQFGGSARSERQNAAFCHLLEDLVETHQVRLVAEEMSLDALRDQNQDESTVAAFARQNRVCHLYCDPPASIHSQMGLRVERNASWFRQVERWSDERIADAIAHEHRIRERYWKNRILEADTWPCLLVCGAEHAVPVSGLFLASGLNASIIAENWDT